MSSRASWIATIPRIYRCRTKEDKEAKEEKGGAGDRNRNDDCTIASNSTRERCKAVIVVDRRLIHLYIYIYMIIDSRIGSTKTRYCWKTQFDNFDDNWDTLAIQLEHLARQKLRVVNLSFASVTATFRKSGDKRQIVRNCSSWYLKDNNTHRLMKEENRDILAFIFLENAKSFDFARPIVLS